MLLSSIFFELVPACTTALLTSSLISSISFVILPTESVLFCASCPICAATTANPLPISPALAASIEALSDRRFVSSAISPISATIFVISSEASPTLSTAEFSSLIEVLMSFIATPIFCMSERPLFDTLTVSCIFSSTWLLSSCVSVTTIASLVAFSAISFTETESWSTVVLSSDIELACVWAEL